MSIHTDKISGVKEFVDGLIDQLKTGTIVDQVNDETGEIAEETDTTLVSAVLHTTAVQIIQMFYEDWIQQKKEAPTTPDKPSQGVSKDCNTREHVMWLLRLERAQARVVIDMLWAIWQEDFWSPRDNKHTVLPIVKEWAEKIDSRKKAE